jgi:hypothetical protein
MITAPFLEFWKQIFCHLLQRGLITQVATKILELSQHASLILASELS